MIHPVSTPPADLVFAQRFRFSERSKDRVSGTGALKQGVGIVPQGDTKLWADLMSRTVMNKFDVGHVLGDSDQVDNADNTEDTPIHAVLYPSDIVGQAKTEDKVLQLKWVDYLVQHNSMLHNTNQYEICQRNEQRQTVLRRGQAFQLTLAASRPINRQTDIMRIVFSLGAEGSASTGTLVSLKCEEKSSAAGWDIQKLDINGDRMSLTIRPSCLAPIGCWNVMLETAIHGQKPVRIDMQQIYVIYNPWLQEDSVFMKSPEDREEYVLNEQTIIFRGCAQSQFACDWTLAQFDDGLLQASLFLLEQSGIKASRRGDVTEVVKSIQKAAERVLDHDWDNSKFKGEGISPSEWTGSASILKEYMAKQAHPVKYGQQWTIAAIVCTCLRALGVGCRITTAYNMPVNTNLPAVTTCNFDVNGHADTERNDKISVYTTWVEFWTTDGWTITRNSTVDLISVNDLKNANIDNHSTKQMFEELNGEIWVWLLDEGRTRLLDRRTYVVDKIVTKSMKNDQAVDLTAEYRGKALKWHENTCKKLVESAALILAHPIVTSPSQAQGQKGAGAEAVLMQTKVNQDTDMGNSIRGQVLISNNTKHKQSVKLTVTLHSIAHDGQVQRLIKKETTMFNDINNGEVIDHPIRITCMEYVSKLNDENTMQLNVFSVVADSDQVCTHSQTIRLQTPQVQFEFAEPVELGEHAKARLKFKNPLPVSLEGGRFMIEGSGLMSNTELVCGEVPANSVVTAPFTVCPWRSGNLKLIAHFESEQLRHCSGVKMLDVK